jgi:YfiH family protein
MSWNAQMRAALGRDTGWLVPDWPAPAQVRAFVTTRAGGVSEGPYASMNLGLSSGDDAGRVTRNRAIVREVLPREPRWLAQVHGVEVASIDHAPAEIRPRADAAVAHAPGNVCTVLTADCMPLLLCDTDGQAVAVAHAGWRGLAAGVIENAVRALGVPAAKTLAWMGPAIGPKAFEVGAEVREAFMAHDARAEAAFVPHGPGKFLADLYSLARQRLEAAGVTAISGGDFCTYTDTGRFFSYRREKQSGRMGAFIWIAP